MLSHLKFVVFLVYLRCAFGDTSQCSVSNVDTLLEGCSELKGLDVTSAEGTSVNDQNCGVLLPKQEFATEPSFQYPSADSNKFYTLLIVDPDAPPRVRGEFFLHMLKSNIPGSALKSDRDSKTAGIENIPYMGPAPPLGTGPHRYIILLFEQADGNDYSPNVPIARLRFELGNWLAGENLCGPVAATMFQAQF